MSQQQQRESKTSSKGGAGHVAPNPDQANPITRKAGQDSQQRRDAHTNSAAAGREDDSDDIRGKNPPG